MVEVSICEKQHYSSVDVLRYKNHGNHFSYNLAFLVQSDFLNNTHDNNSQNQIDDGDEERNRDSDPLTYNFVMVVRMAEVFFVMVEVWQMLPHCLFTGGHIVDHFAVALIDSHTVV